MKPRPIEGLRALVSGHFVVEEVEVTANRWNLDTGAGFENRNRLSLLETNARRLEPLTFDVRETPSAGAGPGAAPNDVVILDNLSSHRGPRIRDRIRAASAELVFPPPCSPDYNPFDLTISSSKALLHKAVGFDPS